MYFRNTKEIESSFLTSGSVRVGAPGDLHGEVSLRYLGDLEISEEATVAELKSQVRLLRVAHGSGGLASSSEILIPSSISFSLTYSLF